MPHIQTTIDPENQNCIVCDHTVNQKEGIVVFEFPGYGVEVFTFPPNRLSLWRKQAVALALTGGIPRWLCNGCHHGTDNKKEKTKEAVA